LIRRLFELHPLLSVMTFLVCQIWFQSGFAAATSGEYQSSRYVSTQRRQDTDVDLKAGVWRWRVAERVQGHCLFMKRDALDLFDSLEPQPSCLDGIYSSSDVKTPGRRHTASNGHSSRPALSADAQGRRNQSPRLVQRLDLGDRAVTQTELPPEQNHSGIDWRSLERELEDWRRTKISEWKSGCGKRPENAEELAELEALCSGLPWNDEERGVDGLCYRPHIETDEEKNRHARCVAHQAGQEMEFTKRYFPQLLRDLGAPPPGDREKLTAISEEFLVLAGMKPEVAKILATYDSHGRSAGPVFAAMLAEGGIGKEEFKNFLNGMASQDDLARLKTLVERARQVPVDESGGFPRTADNDRSLKTPSPALSSDATDPHSLNGVLILGHELFGQRFPGPGQLPEHRP
jgi:hypothetical protein